MPPDVGANMDNIHVLEGRALDWTVRHAAARGCRLRGRRLLIFGDNMSVKCAINKGCVCDWSLLHICRSVGATALAADIRVVSRWVPSEYNPADGPSRRFEPCIRSKRYQVHPPEGPCGAGGAHEPSPSAARSTLRPACWPPRAGVALDRAFGSPQPTAVNGEQFAPHGDVAREASAIRHLRATRRRSSPEVDSADNGSLDDSARPPRSTTWRRWCCCTHGLAGGCFRNGPRKHGTRSSRSSSS